MTITWRHPDALNSHENQFDKLRRAGTMGRGDELRKRLDHLQKLTAQNTASTEALQKRCLDFDRGLAEVEAALRRIEINKAVNERNELGAEQIRRAVNADRPFGPDDMVKALAERAGRNFFH